MSANPTNNDDDGFLRALGRKVLLSIYRRRIHVIYPKLTYCFIHGTMRSGTSALNQVMANHPHVAAAGELHLDYRAKEDLRELAYLAGKWSFLHRRMLVKHCLFLEKVVRIHAFPEFMENSAHLNIRHIFVTRDPLQAISSLVRTGWPEWTNPSDAVAYYIEYIDHMLACAEKVTESQKLIALTYEQLMKSPEKCTAILSEFLSMNPPFSTRYSPKRWTDVEAAGDTSPNIKTGVLRSQPTKPTIPLKEEESHLAYEAHARFLTYFRARNLLLETPEN